MRGLALGAAFALAVAPATGARAAEKGLAFIYVSPNVGLASGGHAALRADDAVYHLQNGDAGLLLLVREGWSSFHLIYAELENRPLEVAHVDVAPGATERVQRAFARLYVEQELELARQTALRDDVAWLEAFERGAEVPPLRGAGLVAPELAGDPAAARLRAAVAAKLEPNALAGLAAASDARIAESARADGDLRDLREALALREAVRALDGAYGLAPAATAQLPAEVDLPLSPLERAALEQIASQLEDSVAELLRSARPDRGYALFLAQARYLAARRSLAANRLVVLDAFAGQEVPEREDDVSDAVRMKRRIQAAQLVRRGRELALPRGALEEENLNLLEEAAAVAARGGRADSAGPLSEYGQRKLPALGRSIPVAAPRGDIAAELAGARARLAEQDARLEARWGYHLTQRNCITELARATGGAFGSEVDAVAALGAPVPPPEETLGWVPFVFFDRVRDRLRIERVEPIPNHRAEELARVLRDSPGPWTAARESAVPTGTIYTPLLRDGAFVLFTDDVFWRRPLYGAVNLAYGVGYSVYGAAAAPFDGGARLHAGAIGVMWSFPELGFVNVRKGSFDSAD